MVETVGMAPEIPVTLTRMDLHEEEYNPYDGEDRPYRPLDLEVGAKRLGPAGCVLLPRENWEGNVPLSLPWALRLLPNQGQSKDVATQVMAETMVGDGLLWEAPPQTPSQFNTFAN